MAIPLLLLAFATLAAAVVAYGTHPGWGGFEGGLQLIVWSRRLQWPLVALAVVLCVILIGTIILGRRRAWWLIGLGPILALFVHHFAPFSPDRAAAMAVLDNPPLTDVAAVTVKSGDAVPGEDDWVVGVTLGDTSYAYPFASLFRAPVVLQTEHGNRMLLLWSAYANRALAFHVSSAVRARDLEVVSEPANALLVYNKRHGQFINGLKGLTVEGRLPTGFGLPLMTTKTTWRQWRSANSAGKLMLWQPAAQPGARAAPFPAPTRPLLPAYAVPGRNGRPAVPAATADRARVVVVGWPGPWAVDGSVIGPAPVNLSADGAAALLLRPGADAPARAFAPPAAGTSAAGTHAAGKSAATQPSRRPDGPVPHFVPVKNDRRHPEAVFRETASDTLWTVDGAGVARTRSAGEHLKPLIVDEDVDRATIEFWYPGVHVIGGD